MQLCSDLTTYCVYNLTLSAIAANCMNRSVYVNGDFFSIQSSNDYIDGKVRYVAYMPICVLKLNHNDIISPYVSFFY